MHENYILDIRNKDLLQWYGVNVEEVLKKAQFPGDALNHRVPTITEEGYRVPAGLCGDQFISARVFGLDGFVHQRLSEAKDRTE